MAEIDLTDYNPELPDRSVEPVDPKQKYKKVLKRLEKLKDESIFCNYHRECGILYNLQQIIDKKFTGDDSKDLETLLKALTKEKLWFGGW